MVRGVQSGIFPLRKCNFAGLQLRCPNDPVYVLEEEFGLDWCIPKRGFKTFDIDPAMKARPGSDKPCPATYTPGTVDTTKGL